MNSDRIMMCVMLWLMLCATGASVVCGLHFKPFWLLTPPLLALTYVIANTVITGHF